MTQPTYPAARLVADAGTGALREAHSAAQGEEGAAGHGDAPSPPAIASIIDAAFWASLRREEGQAPKISLAFLPPEQARHALLFASPLPLVPSMLSKVAPAVERPGIHLGVWHERRGLLCLGHDSRGAGVLPGRGSRGVGTDRRQASLRAVRQVRQRGGARRRSDQDRGRRRGPADSRLPGDGGVARPARSITQSAAGVTAVLIQLAASMRQHGRGGALLVVPAGTDTWRESIVTPVLYAVDPPYAGAGGAGAPQECRSR